MDKHCGGNMPNFFPARCIPYFNRKID